MLTNATRYFISGIAWRSRDQLNVLFQRCVAAPKNTLVLGLCAKNYCNFRCHSQFIMIILSGKGLWFCKLHWVPYLNCVRFTFCRGDSADIHLCLTHAEPSRPDPSDTLAGDIISRCTCSTYTFIKMMDVVNSVIVESHHQKKKKKNPSVPDLRKCRQGPKHNQRPQKQINCWWHGYKSVARVQSKPVNLQKGRNQISALTYTSVTHWGYPYKQRDSRDIQVSTVQHIADVHLCHTKRGTANSLLPSSIVPL